nr:uncharacterized protein LOC117680581 [Crassostrea gigas]XP_034338392.1 uncharacterized protein LOC117680581 [Crassostrea gigas]
MHRINETLILMLTVKFIESENGVCFPERKENKCCARYYLQEGNCFPCNGSIGHHCSLSCLRGHCGIQCSRRCPCDDCDSQTCVCSYSQKSHDDSSAASTRFEYEFVGLIVLGIPLAAFICWIYKRKKRPLEVDCSDLTEETYVEYDMIRESQLILYDDDDDDDDDDDLKRHTVQPCDNVDKQRRLSLDDNSEGGFYNELRYNS